MNSALVNNHKYSNRFPLRFLSHKFSNWDDMKNEMKHIFNDVYDNFYVYHSVSKDPISTLNIYLLVTKNPELEDTIKMKFDCGTNLKYKLEFHTNANLFVLLKIIKNDISLVIEDNPIIPKGIYNDTVNYIQDIFGLKIISVNFFEKNIKKTTLSGQAVEIKNAIKYLEDVMKCSSDNVADNSHDSKKRKQTSVFLDKNKISPSQCLKIVKESTTIYIYKADLAAVKTDSILIPIGPDMQHNHGVGCAVMKKAGNFVVEECLSYGKIKPGEVKCSSAGNLPFKMLFHAYSTPHHLQITDVQSIIESSYVNCLELCKMRGIKSIGLPLLGCGIASIPMDMVVKSLLEAIKRVDCRSIQDIHIVEIRQEAFNSLYNLLTNLVVDIMPCQIPEVGFASNQSLHAKKNIREPSNLIHETVFELQNNLIVQIGIGDLLAQKSDAFVYAVPYGCDAKTGIASEIKDLIGNHLFQKEVVYFSQLVPFKFHITALQTGLFIYHYLYPSIWSSSDNDKLCESFNSIIKDLDEKEVEQVAMCLFPNSCHLDAASLVISKTLFELPKLKCLKKIMILDLNSTKVDTFLKQFGSLVKENTIKNPLISKESNSISNATSNTSDQNEDCPICLDSIQERTQLKCGHIFCKNCIEKSLTVRGTCPTCKCVIKLTIGNQPNGTMKVVMNPRKTLPGFSDSLGTIIITYSFPPGIQTSEHPNPGIPYSGSERTAYLPNNAMGQEVLALLRKAWDTKIIFTIGYSATTGHNNVITWNDIHHKTRENGGPANFGYPDDNYLNRVKDELKSKGID